MKHTLIFLDVESTGKDPEDRLIQIAYKTTDDEKTVNRFYSTDIKIKIEAMCVHHITEKIIADKPRFQESPEHTELEERFSRGDIVVAHNAKFDIAMLEKEGLSTPKSIDTLKVAHFLDRDGKIPSYAMQYLRYFLGIEIEADAHDALGDILVLEKLFYRQLEAMKKLSNVDDDTAINEMIKISKRPLIFKFFTFGKHKNKSIEEVAKQDIGYLEWLYNEKMNEEEKDEDWIATLEKFLK